MQQHYFIFLLNNTNFKLGGNNILKEIIGLCYSAKKCCILYLICGWFIVVWGFPNERIDVTSLGVKMVNHCLNLFNSIE
jgi:hypothetical protein